MFPGGGGEGKGGPAVMSWLLGPLETYALVENNVENSRYISWRRWRRMRPFAHELALWIHWDSYPGAKNLAKLQMCFLKYKEER
jgi:hypothetical protein